MKAAPAWEGSQQWNSAGDCRQTLHFGLQVGHGLDQRLGVGMQRPLENLAHRPVLDDLSRIHHRHVISEVTHDAEVVGDEQYGHAQLFAQVAQQLNDLRLDGDIEGGGGFVGHEQLRLRSERHRDHHTLLHAAGQFVRIISQPRFRRRNADELQQSDDLGIVGDCRPMVFEGLLDLRSDAKDRV